MDVRRGGGVKIENLPQGEVHGGDRIVTTNESNKSSENISIDDIGSYLGGLTKVTYLHVSGTGHVWDDFNATYTPCYTYRKNEMPVVLHNDEAFMLADLVDGTCYGKDNTHLVPNNFFKISTGGNSIDDIIRTLDTSLSSDFIYSNFDRNVNNTTDLEELTNIKEGDYVKTLGYYVAGDGGGNDFTLTADSGHAINKGTGSVWAAKEVNIASFSQFGAVPNDISKGDIIDRKKHAGDFTNTKYRTDKQKQFANEKYIAKKVRARKNRKNKRNKK